MKIIRESKTMDDATLDKLVAQVEDLTDSNNHTGSLIAIAKGFKYTKFIKILDLIAKISDVENNMPEELNDYRNSISKQMYDFIKKDYGQDVYKKIYAAG